MQERFLELMCCPTCRGDLSISAVRAGEGDAIVEGDLACSKCERTYPVVGRIPRFVESSAYAESFGWQWTRFHKLQRDSYNGTDTVRRTILKRSGWTPQDLAGKLVLECGCGSGNDTEVLADLAGTLVSADLSRAVGSVAPEVLARPNVLVMQADLTRLPLRTEAFDVGYCHRVIQHTPDPAASFQAMSRHVRPGGVFFLHSYSRHWKSMLNYKYWLRPITARLPHGVVYRALRIVGPVLYPLVGGLNRLAFLRRLNRLVIPFENHARALKKAGTTLTARERYEYSFLITFDALTPIYDNPSSAETVRGWIEAAGFVDVEIRFENPVIAIARRATSTVEIQPPQREDSRGSRLEPDSV